MPYPILLAAGAAMAAAGAGMGMAGAAESKGAMNEARNAELLRQRGYQEQADKTVQASIGQSTRGVTDKQLAEGEASRNAGYAKVGQVVPGAQSASLPGQNGTVTAGEAGSGPTARAAATASKTANAWGRLVGGAQAKLGSYQDWGLAQRIKDARANSDLSVTNSFARGSANVLPVEMEAASHTGDELAGWGQLVGALGSATGMAGAVGMGPMIGGSHLATAASTSAPEWALAGSNAPLASVSGATGANPWSYAAMGVVH